MILVVFFYTIICTRKQVSHSLTKQVAGILTQEIENIWSAAEATKAKKKTNKK